MDVKPLIQISDVKTFLPFQSGYSTEDAKLSALVLLATRQIEEFTRRNFTTQTFTELFSTRKNGVLEYSLVGDSDTGLVQRAREQIFQVSGWPLRATGFTVYYDPAGEFASSSQLDSTYYKIDLDRSRFVLLYPTQRTFNGLKVVYDAGFAIEDGSLAKAADAELKHACVLQVIHLWNRSKSINVGVTDDRGEGDTMTSRFSKIGGLTPEAASLVGRYRKMLAGAN